ncbi:pilus assembly protein [Sphingomonas sp. I4]
MLTRLSSRRRPGTTRSILSDRRGATIVEFALVATPFIALILAILQTSLAYFAQEALESAVEISARSVVTGQAQFADIQSSGQGMTPPSWPSGSARRRARGCPASCRARGSMSMCGARGRARCPAATGWR